MLRCATVRAMTMDYKATLNLPQTDFPMKANLPQREPEILARWERERLYELIQEARRGRPLYVLHDGPPYANGRIHIGHALNKILKDIIVKSKTMEGYQVPFGPGRGRGRVRGAHLAVDLRKVSPGELAPSALQPRGPGRQLSIRRQDRLDRDLDDHAVDVARQPGRVPASGLRLCVCAGRGRGAGDRREAGGCGGQGLRPFQVHRSGGQEGADPVWRVRGLALPPPGVGGHFADPARRIRHSGARDRVRAHRAGAWAGRLRAGAQVQRPALSSRDPGAV